MEKINKVSAGIVLFNPDLERLELNIRAIINQVSKLILVDNGSKNINEIKELYLKDSKIEICAFENNMGIARALNKICEVSIENKFDWVYLLDQDSISMDGIIDEYNYFLKNYSFNDVALLSPKILDINSNMKANNNSEIQPKFQEIKFAITSGSMISLDCYQKTEGFREELFIDTVDTDYSMQLNIMKFKQFQINTAHLIHELGRIEQTNILVPTFKNKKLSFRKLHRTNHSRIRIFYICRNNIIFIRRYSNYLSLAEKMEIIIMYIIKILIVEKNKIINLRTTIEAFKEGMRFNFEK